MVMIGIAGGIIYEKNGLVKRSAATPVIEHDGECTLRRRDRAAAATAAIADAVAA